MTAAEVMTASATSLAAAYRKIGAARKIVEQFWSIDGASNPHDPKIAWAMHVALVQLAEVFRRGSAR